MTRKERLRKWLILAFWTGLLFTLWFSYDYACLLYTSGPSVPELPKF